MKTPRYVLIRATTNKSGHGTYICAKFWRQELIDLLAQTSEPSPLWKGGQGSESASELSEPISGISPI